MSSVPNESKAPEVRLSEQKREPGHSAEPGGMSGLFWFVYFFLMDVQKRQLHGDLCGQSPTLGFGNKSCKPEMFIYFIAFWNVFALFFFFFLLLQI